MTYQNEDGPRGATVNSFTSISVEPPLILVALSRSSQASAGLDGRAFAVNVLRTDQLDVAMQFAGRPTRGLSIDWELSGSGTVPTLADAIAVYVCRPWRRYDGGDHVLQVGEVHSALRRPGDPLVFTDGRFTTTALSPLDEPVASNDDDLSAPRWTGAVQRLHSDAEPGWESTA